jgi:hypothetical protein
MKGKPRDAARVSRLPQAIWLIITITSFSNSMITAAVIAQNRWLSGFRQSMLTTPFKLGVPDPNYEVTNSPNLSHHFLKAVLQKLKMVRTSLRNAPVIFTSTMSIVTAI